MLFKPSTLTDDLLPTESLVSAKLLVNPAKALLKTGKINQALSDVLGDWDMKTDLHYVSHGHWSLHNLLEWILPRTGAATIYIATWSMSEDATRMLINLTDAGLIKEIKAILDYRTKNRHEASFYLAKSRFAQLHTTSCHAKVTVIEAERHWITINGSPNFTNNPRIESGMISVAPEVGQWHKKWIMDVIERVPVFE